jgi:hypothetical protein
MQKIKKSVVREIRILNPPLGLITESLPGFWRGMKFTVIPGAGIMGEHWQSLEQNYAGYLVSKDEIIERMEATGGECVASILRDFKYSTIKIPYKYCEPC